MIAVANSVNTLMVTSYFRPSSEEEKEESDYKKATPKRSPENNIVF
ncbi:hypothetical protein PSI19_19675 [Xenorhabdus khoisanae]|nr:hypothetical protein [Xenorhabdus khoisanae]